MVARPRLARRLRVAELPALTLVSAPAGFGKTTLLAEWAGTAGADGARVAWVSLDRRDDDPTVFWSYVAAALASAAPGVGLAEDAAALAAGTGAGTDAVVARLLNELGAARDEIVLVLDDFHLVESHEVHDAVVFLLDHLPAHVHVVLGTRADPPWPLAGRRARGQLLELRAGDLRFDADETATYLNDVMGLSLADGDVDALEARTEGWIAALQLAALSLQGRDDATGFIHRFAGDDRFILDYLVNEVLDRQAPAVRTFLLRTSILARLSAPLCEAVTGEPDAKARLDGLERANLFLVALDDQRVWYRYHHLFADVLQARLLDEQPELVPVLHRRASDWHEQHGDRPEAIRHALAAPDPVRAAELVELAMPAMRRRREEATLRRWYDALPAELLPDRPVLAIGLVGARMASGQLDGVEALLDGVERRLGPAADAADVVVVDRAELARLPAQTAMYRAGLALLTGDVEATTAHASRALEHSAADDHLGRGAASALLGLARWNVGDLAAAEHRYADAVAAFHRVGHHADILGCSRALADIQAAQGRLGAAIGTLEDALDVVARHGPLRGAADVHDGLAELRWQRNELDEARRHLRTAAELGEVWALPQHAYRWRVASARVAALEGDVAGALALLDEAERRYDTDFSPSIRPVPAVRARLQLACGDLEAAARWVRGAGVAADGELGYLREYEHLTLVRWLLARHRTGASDTALTEATTLLDRLLAAARDGGRDSGTIEVLALRALAHHAGGDTPAALASLGEAVGRAAPEGYVRVFLDEGAPMLDLLRAAREQPVPPATGEHLTRLLAAAGPPAAPAPPPVSPAGRRAPTGLVDELSSREREVLRLLRSELSGPEIARELVVSLNTVRTHTRNIYTKLGVTNRRAAVRRADELGLWS